MFPYGKSRKSPQTPFFRRDGYPPQTLFFIGVGGVLGKITQHTWPHRSNLNDIGALCEDPERIQQQDTDGIHRIYAQFVEDISGQALD